MLSSWRWRSSRGGRLASGRALDPTAEALVRHRVAVAAVAIAHLPACPGLPKLFLPLSTPRPRRYYIFYFDLEIEGEETYALVLDARMPHRLQKYYASAYAGATSLGRGWGKIYIPEQEIDRFMALTGNRLAPEPGMYTEAVSGGPDEGIGARLTRWIKRFRAR